RAPRNEKSLGERKTHEISSIAQSHRRRSGETERSGRIVVTAFPAVALRAARAHAPADVDGAVNRTLRRGDTWVAIVMCLTALGAAPPRALAQPSEKAEAPACASVTVTTSASTSAAWVAAVSRLRREVSTLPPHECPEIAIELSVERGGR